MVMKRKLLILIVMMLPLMAMSQGVITRPGKKPAKTVAWKNQSQQTSDTNGGRTLKSPAAPTSITDKNRTIYDLLYFPYVCLPKEIDTEKKAQGALSSNFGSYEIVNNIYVGLHRNKRFDFSYKGVPIGLSHIDWFDNRTWYMFYLRTKADADKFYKSLVDDIIKTGIPLKKDKVYGGYSNRKQPVSIFKWVYVSPALKVEKADNSNINISDYVEMYCVELGVYKRKIKK